MSSGVFFIRLSAVLFAFLNLASVAQACTAEKMKTTENGFIFKVVGGSNNVEAKKTPGSKDVAFTLELLAPYF
ncbi:MAG: VWA domain-containing protein, partial [Pseudorhodoplanes sp.]|nr:VWA domain-containing protein [Pseudorhodoplanes sp.]